MNLLTILQKCYLYHDFIFFSRNVNRITTIEYTVYRLEFEQKLRLRSLIATKRIHVLKDKNELAFVSQCIIPHHAEQ